MNEINETLMVKTNSIQSTNDMRNDFLMKFLVDFSKKRMREKKKHFQLNYYENDQFKVTP